MIADVIEKTSIEEIIYWPDFVSLESGGGVENIFMGEPLKQPYWKITFRGKSVGNGQFEWNGHKSIFPTFVFFKYKIQSLQNTQS